MAQAVASVARVARAALSPRILSGSGGNGGSPAPSSSPPLAAASASSGTPPSSSSSSAAVPTPSPSPSPSPSPAANALSSLLARIDAAFASGPGGVGANAADKSASSSLSVGRKDRRLDDSAADLLAELDRWLESACAPGSPDRPLLSKSHSSLLKTLLERVLPRCDNQLLRVSAGRSLERALSVASQEVSNVYHDLLRAMEGREQGARVGAMHAFALLSARFGQQFMLSIPETLGALYKLVKARDELVVRQLALDIVAGYYAGTGGGTRAAGSNESTHLDMERLLARIVGDARPQAAGVRKKALSTARAVVFYSVDCRELDSLLSLALKVLQSDSETADVRFHAAECVGDMLSFACRKDWGKIAESARKSTTKPVRKVHGDIRNLDEVWQFVERLLATTNQRTSAAAATTPANLSLRTAYTHLLSRCLRNLSVGNPHNLASGSLRLDLPGRLGCEASGGKEGIVDESNVVSQVNRFLAMLGRGKFIHGGSSGPVVVGGAASLSAFNLPSREPPLLDPLADQNARQQCSLLSHSLLTHVLPFQSERGLESVGKAVVSFLGGIVRSSSASPAAAVQHGDLGTNYQVLLCFQILSFLFARLGLAVEFGELKDSCLEVLLFFLTHSQYAIRIACASCFRSLARAASPALATWLSVLYKIVTLQLVEVEDSASNAAAALSPGRRSSPAVAENIDPTPYHSLHGHIAALAAIVGVIPEAPCGVPSLLIDSVFDVARKLIGLVPESGSGAASTPSSPPPPNLPHLHAMAESGWQLLSALCSLGFEWNSSRLNALFALWRATLGRKPASGRLRQEEVAQELRLRAKALLALRTFVHVMRFKLQMVGGAPSPLLRATLTLVRNTFALLRALHAEKSLEPSVQLSLASLKALLMDIFAALPPQSYSSTFVPLLHVVVSEFTSKNPPLSSELQRTLNRADAPLNAPFVCAGSSSGGGAEEQLVRFVDLSDPSDTNPILSPSGTPQPSPTSFYDLLCAGGNVVPDYSWDWSLRAATHTDTVREMANAGAGSAAGSVEMSPTAASGPEDERALDSLGGEGFDESGAPLGFDSDSGDSDSSLSSGRPLFSSLRNHLDRWGSAGAAAHATECFEPPAVRAVNACVRLFGALYAEQSATHQEQLAKHFLAIVTKARAMSSLHSNIVSNVSAALLAVARDLAERDSGGLRSPQALDCMLSVCTELMGVSSPLVRRAVGETLGLLVRVEGDELLHKLFSALQGQLHAKDGLTQTTAVFALGCVHRYGGAMKTMRHLPFTLAALQSLGRDFSEPTRIWILHALWLAIDAGGISFSAYVQPTQAILSAHASHDVDARSPAVNQALGRILHAVLGALGPDVALASVSGSAAGSVGGAGAGVSGGAERFLNLWTHLRALGGEAGVGAQIECVNVLHQLALWTSASEVGGAMPLLARALASEEEELRRSAVRTLLQCGERDPSSMLLRHSFEKRVMSMIDTEHSPAMIALLKHTVGTWVASPAAATPTSEPEQGNGTASPAPSADTSLRYRLFDMCKRAVVGSHRLPSDAQTMPVGMGDVPAPGGKKSKRAAAQAAAAGGDDAAKDEDDDEDDGGILGSSSTSSAPSRSKASSSSAADEDDEDGSNLHLLFQPSETRWQTKCFALECLTALLRASAKNSDPHDFDLAYARRHARFPLQYLVQQLSDVLTVSCLATSSALDMLRIRGTVSMRAIVDVFGSVPDPDALEGEEDDPDASAGNSLLLQLYQAQVTSALTQSMKSASDKSEWAVSAPQLRARACELAVVFLSSGVTTDPAVFARIVKLLLAPLLQPSELLDHLNGMFDGQMGTLVVLSHLHALAALHQIVLENPSVGLARGGKARSSKPLSPRQQSIVSLRETLKPHFRLLHAHYAQALKDHVLVSSLSRRELGRTKGFYFDGSSTSNALPVYLSYWELFLRNTASVLATDPDSFASVVASDGSAGSERARQELLVLCLGVCANSLSLIAAHEARSASALGSGGTGGARGDGLPRASGGLARSFSDKLKRHANLDASTLSRADRERDSSYVLSCLAALQGLLAPSHFREGYVTSQTLSELLPLVSWFLSHRPAGAEVSTLSRRQSAALAVLRHVLSVLRELQGDPARMESFLASSSASGAASAGSTLLDGSVDASSPSSLGGLLSMMSDALVHAAHSFLPTFFGGSSSPANYNSGAHKLAEGGVYITGDVLASLQSIVGLLHPLLDVVARSVRGKQNVESAAVSQLCLSLHLCVHVMRKASSELCQTALATFTSLLFNNSAGSEGQQRLLPPPVLLHQLTQQLRNILLNPLPLHADFRVESLLGALYTLTVSSLADDSSDQDVSDAVAPFVGVWNEFAQHASSRFRMLALQSLARHILLPPDLSLPPAVLALSQRCVMALLSQVGSGLLQTLASGESVEERTAAAVASLRLFSLFTSEHPRAESIQSQWIALLLPPLVDLLDSAPACVTHVVALATQQPALFKANVALLPAAYRSRLQSAVLSMTAEQQAAAMAQAAAVQAKQAPPAASATQAATTGESCGKGKKKKRDSHASTGSSTLPAAPTIALADFSSKFKSKK